MNAQQILAAIAASPELQALAAQRLDTDIAVALSAGRRKLVPTSIGAGTVLDVCRHAGLKGGDLLNALQQAAAADSDVYWGFDALKRGAFRIDMQSSRDALEDIKAALPAYAAHIDAVLTLGWADDPLPVDAVSAALNAQAQEG